MDGNCHQGMLTCRPNEIVDYTANLSMYMITSCIIIYGVAAPSYHHKYSSISIFIFIIMLIIDTFFI